MKNVLATLFAALVLNSCASTNAGKIAQMTMTIFGNLSSLSGIKFNYA